MAVPSDNRWRRLVDGVALLFDTTSPEALKRITAALPHAWMGAEDVAGINKIRYVLYYGEDRIVESPLGAEALDRCLSYLDGAIAKYNEAKAAARRPSRASDSDADSDAEPDSLPAAAASRKPQPQRRRWARNEKPKELTEADPRLEGPVERGRPWTVDLLRKLYLDMEDWATRRLPPSRRMSPQDYHSNIRPAQHRAFYNPLYAAKQYDSQKIYWFQSALGSFPDQGSVLAASGLPHWHKDGFQSPYWFSKFWKYLSSDAVVDGVPVRKQLPIICVANGHAVADLGVLQAGIDGWATERKFIIVMRLLYEYMEFHVLERIRHEGKGWADILDDECFVAQPRAVPEPAGKKRRAPS